MEVVKEIRQFLREQWADFLAFLKVQPKYRAFGNPRTPYQPRYLRQKDLEPTASHLRETVAGMENLLLAGRLRELERNLKRNRVAHVVGPRISECYRLAAGSAPDCNLEFRRSNVAVALDLFSEMLNAPAQVFPAEAHLYKNRHGRESIIGATVSCHGTAYHLRLDQLLAACGWGVGFLFEPTSAQDLLAIERFSHAVFHLSLGLAGIQSIQNLARETPEDLRVFPEPAGYRFEQLMIDILNEHRRQANRAPLIEDFFEKTDLRYKNPALGRRRGARVQVTYTIQPDFHQEKLAKIKRPEELIILSPLALANALSTMREPLSQRFHVGDLWDCVGKVATVPELAESLREILLQALNNAHAHPLGPMGSVPEPVRELIRVFVDIEAFRSTHALRSREQTYGPARTINYARRKIRKRLRWERPRQTAENAPGEPQRTQA